MGLFSKPAKWIRRQTHGGLSLGGLKSSAKGFVKHPLGKLAIGAAAAPLLGMAGGAIASRVGGLFGDQAGDVAGDAIEGLSGGDIGGSRSRFRRIGDFLGGEDGFDGDDLLKYGKAAGSAYGAYGDMKRQNRLENIANDEYNRRAPAREAAQRLLLDESRPDLSDVFDERPRRYRRVNVGGY